MVREDYGLKPLPTARASAAGKGSSSASSAASSSSSAAGLGAAPSLAHLSSSDIAAALHPGAMMTMNMPTLDRALAEVRGGAAGRRAQRGGWLGPYGGETLAARWAQPH